MATSTSVNCTASASGQGSDCTSASPTGAPPAAAQRSRNRSPSARAAGPASAVVASCQGLAIRPLRSRRPASPSRCARVSQRSANMSMPPQKASRSSITTIFWWCEPVGGWWPSSRAWMRLLRLHLIRAPRALPLSTIFNSPTSQRRMKISSSGRRAVSQQKKSAISRGPSTSCALRSRSRSPSKSQPISRIRFSARSIACRAWRK